MLRLSESQLTSCGGGSKNSTGCERVAIREVIFEAPPFSIRLGSETIAAFAIASAQTCKFQLMCKLHQLMCDLHGTQ